MPETEVVHTVMPEGYHHREIKNALQFLQCLVEGQWAWPGGYPLYFICKDGDPLSFEAAREFEELIVNDINDGYGNWCVVGLDTNEEDSALFCSHTNERIESAYAEPEEVEEHNPNPEEELADIGDPLDIEYDR